VTLRLCAQRARGYCIADLGLQLHWTLPAGTAIKKTQQTARMATEVVTRGKMRDFDRAVGSSATVCAGLHHVS
jgi:hypothetical protein